MPNEDGSIGITQGLKIKKAEEQDGFPVTFNDWDFIKEKVRKIKPTQKALAFIANFLTGVCGSAFVTQFTLPDDIFSTHKTINTILWFVVIISMTISVVCYIIDKRIKHIEIEQERTHIIENMERIERPYKIQV